MTYKWFILVCGLSTHYTDRDLWGTSFKHFWNPNLSVYFLLLLVCLVSLLRNHQQIQGLEDLHLYFLLFCSFSSYIKAFVLFWIICIWSEVGVQLHSCACYCLRRDPGFGGTKQQIGTLTTWSLVIFLLLVSLLHYLSVRYALLTMIWDLCILFIFLPTWIYHDLRGIKTFTNMFYHSTSCFSFYEINGILFGT